MIPTYLLPPNTPSKVQAEDQNEVYISDRR